MLSKGSHVLIVNSDTSIKVGKIVEISCGIYTVEDIFHDQKPYSALQLCQISKKEYLKTKLSLLEKNKDQIKKEMKKVESRNFLQSRRIESLKKELQEIEKNYNNDQVHVESCKLEIKWNNDEINKTKKEIEQENENPFLKKLREIADELNGDWKPNWNLKTQNKYVVTYDVFFDKWCVALAVCDISKVYFKTPKDAENAIEILKKEFPEVWKI